jgi:TusA-related sulfurtransferase
MQVMIVLSASTGDNDSFDRLRYIMCVLDLRSIRCPLALVTLKLTLKRKLLLISDTTSDIHKGSLKVLFSTESAMSDIKQYLDKKAYQYQLLTEEKYFILLINITDKGTSV